MLVSGSNFWGPDLKQIVTFAALVAVLAASPAFAHVGLGTSGFAYGLEHPVFGPDHLLAMVAVGLWAALAAPGLALAAPAGFLGGMLAGGLMGFAGIETPMVETMIVGSVILFGLLALFSVRTSAVVAFGLAAVFGAAHGVAHGAELPASVDAASYAVGFLLATAALHALGLGAGLAVRRFSLPRLGQAAGGAVALAGAALLVG